MRIEGLGNAGAVEIQGLTASEFLPQLPQDDFLLCGWYADSPGICQSARWEFNQFPATEINFLTPMNTGERG